MAHECPHRDYYGQFVNDAVKCRVVRRVGMVRILASTDEHMNDIPLHMWYSIGSVGSKTQWDAVGDYPSAAGYVCIYKEAARQIQEIV